MTNIGYLIEAAYRGVLGRSPDPAGMKAWSEEIASGLSFEEFLQRLIVSDEFMLAVQPTVLERARQHGDIFILENSQYGEVEILIREMIASASICRLVVDVGARGRERSNSFDLCRQFGWTALLIEANPSIINDIEADFNGLNVSVVCNAVSDYNGEAVIYLGANLDVSSLNPKMAASWGALHSEVPVQVRRLPEILAERDIPLRFDVLSLDIEGEDIKVLNDLMENSPYRARWVIIEASHNFDVKTLADLEFSKSVRKEYEIKGQTTANLVLKHKRV